MSRSDKAQLIFVLGGPGSGKGTQCDRLVSEFQFGHLSVGDLLRAEINQKTADGLKAESLVANGQIVPFEITLRILLKAIQSAPQKKILIDGFPRSLDQALEFEKSFREIDFILNYECSEETLVQRLLERAKTSGRSDDNLETIKKRIQVFNDQTKPVLDYYAKFGKVRNINASGAVAEVYESTLSVLEPNLLLLYAPLTPKTNEVAERLAEHLSYVHINLDEHVAAHRLEDQPTSKKGDQLYEHLFNHQSKNFILHVSGFNSNEIRHLLSHKVRILRLVYLDGLTEKDINDVLEALPESDNRRNVMKRLAPQHALNLQQVLKFIGEKSYFSRVDGTPSVEEIVSNVVKTSLPTWLLKIEGDAKDIQTQLINTLHSEKQFVTADVGNLVAEEVKRNTDLGKSINNSVPGGDLSKVKDVLKLRALAKNLFQNADHRKFIIQDYITSKQQLDAFEKDIGQLDLLVHCSKAAPASAELLKDPVNAELHGRGRLLTLQSSDASAIEKLIPVASNKKAHALAGTVVGLKEVEGNKLAVKIEAKPQIIFVLGGPGSGKGTQCDKLVKDFGFKHISIGDLMRAEIEKRSLDGQRADDLVKKGQIVPMEITLKLLVRAITTGSARKYLIDGFPRSLDQAIEFEKSFREIDLILNYDVNEDILTERLLERGKTSGRADDNIETIRNRIQVFNRQTKPVLDYYAQLGKVKNISGLGTISDVYHRTCSALAPNVVAVIGPPSTRRFDAVNRLGNHLGYKVIDAIQYWRDLQLSYKSDELKVASLYQYIRDHPEKNFILSSFPQNSEQANLLYDGRVQTLRVYNIDVADGDVLQDINNLQTTDQKIEYRQLYANYQENKASLLKSLGGRDFYASINTSVSKVDDILAFILKDFNLCLIKVEKGESEPLYKEYIANMIAKKNYVHLPFVELTKREIERGTELGRKLNESQNKDGKIRSEIAFRLLRKYIFALPSQKSFMITDYIGDRDQLLSFNKEVAPLACLVTFAKTGKLKPEVLKDGVLAEVSSKHRLLTLSIVDVNGVDSLLSKLHESELEKESEQIRKDEDRPQIVYVLGGPGSGKGTQCEKLVRDFKYTHISVGDLMRAEIKSGSPDGVRIKDLVAKGQIVPTDVTVHLLMKAIKAGTGAKKFLIDGFPRGLEQAIELERSFREIDFILNFEAPEDVLEQRLLGRAKTSGRADDNLETIRERIKVFNEQTRPVLDYYWRFGKVRNINSIGDVNQVYDRVLEALKPNLICLCGPPSKQCKKTGKKLAKRLGYNLINVDKFWAKRGLTAKGDESKATALVEYLRDSAERNFVLGSFPQTRQQATIVFEHFAKPNKVYYLETPKDEVLDYVQHKKKPEKSKVRQAKFDLFLANRGSLADYFKDKSYFVKVDGSKAGKKSLKHKIFDIDYKPLIIRSYRGENEPLHDDYIAELEHKKGFVILPFYLLIQREIQRGTDLGKRLEAEQAEGKELPAKLLQELLRRLLYSNPVQKRFVLGDYPNELDEYDSLAKHVAKVDYLLYFSKKGENGGGRLPLFKTMTALTHHYIQGKLIFMEENIVDLIDKYIQKQMNYGIIIGPPSSGKSLVARHLGKKYGYKVMTFEDTVEHLKKALAKDGQPLEEVPNNEVFDYLKKRIGELSAAGETVVFDNVSATHQIADIKKLFEVVGDPAFVIKLTPKKETIISRVKAIKEIAGDLPEDEAEAIDKGFQRANELGAVFDELAKNSLAFKSYNIDLDSTFASIIAYINFLLSKRVFIARCDAIEKKYGFSLFPLLSAICARLGIIPVHVPSVIQARVSDYLLYENPKDELGVLLVRELEMAQVLLDKGDKKLFRKGRITIQPSWLSPRTVCKVLNEHLKNFQVESNVVLLFGYPSADQPKQSHKSLSASVHKQLLFPRAIDELAALEEQIGEVKMVISFAGTQEFCEINDPLEDPPKIEKKPEVEVKADDDGGDAKPVDPPADGDEDAKPKFNPALYKWSRIDVGPKTLGQIFNKMKPTAKVAHQLDVKHDEDVENIFVTLIDQINQTNETIFAELLV